MDILVEFPPASSTNQIMHMGKMEQFLAQFSYLKHLNLKIIAAESVFNGYRWKELTKNLRTFNFYLNLSGSILPVERMLQSFSSSFWLKEKRWFVAYQNGCLFSIPHFIPDHMYISDSFHLHTTAPDRSLIFEHIKTVILDIDLLEFNSYLPHVETLSLQKSISHHTIKSILDLNEVKHLKLQSINQLIEWMPLEINCPQLCRLSIRDPMTFDLIRRIRMYKFKQIRQLELHVTGEYEDYVMKTLFRIFPSVEQFLYNARIPSKELMFLCIDGFKHLEYASFFAENLSDRTKKNFYQNVHSNNANTRRIRKTNLTYQMYISRSVHSESQICWWIGEQVDQ